MTKKKTHENNTGSRAGKKVGLLAAVTALAAGAYLLTGERGVKNRKKVKQYYEKTRKDVANYLQEVKEEISKKNYDELVERTAKKYRDKMADIGQADVDAVVAELKKAWKNIEVGKKGSPAKKTVSAVRKPAAKKAPKTAAVKKAPTKRSTPKRGV